MTRVCVCVEAEKYNSLLAVKVCQGSFCAHIHLDEGQWHYGLSRKVTEYLHMNIQGGMIYQYLLTSIILPALEWRRWI